MLAYRLAGLFAAILLVALPPAVQAAGNDATSCAAIAFRPVTPGQKDGEQEAGFYKSHLGRIQLQARVKGGVAENYSMALDGKKLDPIAAVPDWITACAKAKRLTPPAAADVACTGDRLVVLLAHTEEHRYILLYAHRGTAWHFCSAGTS